MTQQPFSCRSFSQSLPHQRGPNFWWVSAADRLSFWSPGIEMLCKEKAPGAFPAWASTDFFNSTELLLSLYHAQWLLLLQIQVLPVRCSSNTPSTAGISSLDRSIKYIMSLISVVMVAIMGQSDLGRASKLPTEKLNLPCQYPLVFSLLFLPSFTVLLLLFYSWQIPKVWQQACSSWELCSQQPSFAFPTFLPPGKLIPFG